MKQMNFFVNIYKALDATIFKKNSYYMYLTFLIIKYSTVFNNLEYLSKAIRKIYSKNNTIFNLYYFLLNFFVGYVNNGLFRTVLTNMRRVYLRNVSKRSKNYVSQGNEDHLYNDAEITNYDDFTFICGNVPLFLYPETLDNIDIIF